MDIAMTSYLLAGPAEEPVTLAEAKAWLKLDGSDEDALVSTLIAAARLHVEGTTGRALLAQTWRLVLDRWPENFVIRLPVSPVMSLSAIIATDGDGLETEVALDGIELGRSELLLPADFAFPALRGHQGVAIDYVSGYGEDAEAVPQPLKQALLLLMAYWFEHRDTVFASGAVTPVGFEPLVAPYRTVRL
jgi:uncharacterized phiE125 gp8 family phage protein